MPELRRESRSFAKYPHVECEGQDRKGYKEVRYVDALLKLMSALTGDERYEDQINEWHKKGGPVTMSEIVNNFIEQGRKEGLEQGLKRGLAQGAETAKRESICAVADVFSVKELSKRFVVPEEQVFHILAEAGISPKSEE